MERREWFRRCARAGVLLACSAARFSRLKAGFGGFDGALALAAMADMAAWPGLVGSLRGWRILEDPVAGAAGTFSQPPRGPMCVRRSGSVPPGAWGEEVLDYSEVFGNTNDAAEGVLALVSGFAGAPLLLLWPGLASAAAAA